MRVRLACVALALGSVFTITAADAGSIGRAKFVKRADNICQPQRNDAKRRIIHGVKLLDRKRVRAAGREFVSAYRELRTGYRRVSRLPRPHRDHKRIAKWLHREREATSIGVRSAIALKHKQFARARQLAHEAAVREQDAARPVRNLDFEHCRPL